MANHNGTPNLVKNTILLLGMVLAIYILGPPLYWHVIEGVAALKGANCPPCDCECPAESLSALPAALGNTSLADCGINSQEVHNEMDRSYSDLLAEELKLQEIVAADNQQRADASLLEAKKMASQYQKEAEKCNAGMDTCEEARERAEAALMAEKRTMSLWEQRARQLGWKEDMVHSDPKQGTTNQAGHAKQ